jgi:hypothetical protein
MRSQWKSLLMIAALALFMGIAGPAWSQFAPPTFPLADPMAEDYAVHVIPFYKIDANWSAFLVIADTSWRDLDGGSGSDIHLKFFNAVCNYKQDAILRPTTADAKAYALHDPFDADGQFGGLVDTAPEGVILLDGDGDRFLTYVLLINGNNNSLIRIDSIPCQGFIVNGFREPCKRGNPETWNGTWLRYDTFNTVAATFGDSGDFATNLYFFSAPDESDLEGDLLMYGRSRHWKWADGIRVNAWCDEIYLGSRRRDLKCTERVPLSEFNYTFLKVFPNHECFGQPGHIETHASANGEHVFNEDYSGFQETIATLVHPANLIGTGYMHHSESLSFWRPRGSLPVDKRTYRP